MNPNSQYNSPSVINSQHDRNRKSPFHLSQSHALSESTPFTDHFEHPHIDITTINGEANIQFIEFIEDVLVDFNKNKYRKIILDIAENETLFSTWNEANGLIINHIKIKTIFKIIDKKIDKYTDKRIIKGVENWLKFAENAWKDFEFKLSSNHKQRNRMVHFEKITGYHLTILYYYAYIAVISNNIHDAVQYLMWGENMINSLGKELMFPETWYSIQKIFLLLSSILISEECYELGKGYLAVAMHICYNNLELVMNDTEVISNWRAIYNNDIMNNYVIIFYQLGVCFENWYNFKQASNAYTQAQSFSKRFLNNDNELLCKYLDKVNTRFKNYCLVNKWIDKHKGNIPQNVESRKTKKTKFLFIEDEIKRKRYLKWEEYLGNLSIKQIDDDEPDLFLPIGKKKKSKYEYEMTNTVNLLDYLMSNDFREIVEKMNHIEINDWDRDTKVMLQKQIHEIKRKDYESNSRLINKSSIWNSRQFKKHNQAPSLTTPNSLNYLHNHQYHINYKSKGNAAFVFNKLPVSTVGNHFTTFYPKASSYNMNSLHNKTHSSYWNSYSSSFNIPTKSNTRSCWTKQSKSIEKVKYDFHSFNRTFRRKLNYWDSQLIKEYRFQKKFLNLKKYEYIRIGDYNEDKTKDNLESMCKWELGDVQNKIKEKEKGSMIQMKELKQELMLKKLKVIYETKMCKSLDFKQIEAFNEIQKKILATAPVELKKKYGWKVDETIDDELMYHDNSQEKNKKMWNKLGEDINRWELRKVKNSLKRKNTQKCVNEDGRERIKKKKIVVY